MLPYHDQILYIPTVTEKGKITGQIERWEAHKKGILHKGFSVVLHYQDSVILQLRKHPVFDKVVDLTASSHPLVINGKNQVEEDAVYNCLVREWNVQKDELTKFTNCGSFVYKAPDGAGYIEHEYCTFYSAVIDRLPSPNSEFAYGYISVDLEFFKDNPQMYNLAPWVKEGIDLLYNQKMKKVERFSIQRIILGVVLGSILLIVVGIAFLLKDACETRTAPEIVSPTGAYSIQTEDMNCGATTGYITDVSITKLKPPTSHKNVFSFHGTTESVSISWLNENTVKIAYKLYKPYCADADVYGKHESWNEVKVVYEEQCVSGKIDRGVKEGIRFLNSQ